MKKALLILITLSATVPANALFGPRYDYDEYGNRYERRGLLGTVASGIVNTGEDVVDVATSPVRGGYRNVRLNTVENRIVDVQRELARNRNSRERRADLQAELRSLRAEKRDLLRS